MNKKYNLKYSILMLFFLISVHFTFSQIQSKPDIDFLSQDSFEELSNAYKESRGNLSSMKSFAEAFLAKAKQEGDSLKMAEGYYKVASNLTSRLLYNEALPYLDSTIAFSKKKYTAIYPAKAYILKANIKGAQTHFMEAMNQLSIANDYAQKTDNIDQQHEIKFFIALLKNNVGEYQEGLSLLKESVRHLKQKFLKDSTYSHWYLHSKFALASQFNQLKQPDSALAYLKEPMILALKLKDSVVYTRMLLSTIKALNLKSEYERSLDSLKKYDAIIRDIEVRIGTELRVAINYGHTYFKQGKTDIALPYLKKVDSLAFADSFFFNGLEENYKFLIAYYRDKKNIEQQLHYINKLLTVDSILDKNETYLSKKLHTDYDIPNLIEEKKNIIDQLETEKQNRFSIIISLSIVSSFLFVLLIWYYQKQKKYKKHFEKLLSEDFHLNIEPNTSNPQELDIPESIIESVLKKLESFEEKQGFLQLNLTVNSIAKEFDTNSKYFSKIINTYKGKSFTNYINDLRIEHAVNELKNKPKFRKYTVKAIANEIGFNTTEAFSKSFYKMTGIYPSFFIKQLEKQ